MTMTAPMIDTSRADDAFDTAIDPAAEPPYAATPVNLPALVAGPPSRRWIAVLFVALAILWTAAAIWGATTAITGRQLNAAVAVSWFSAAATPLTLIAVAYLLWRRSPVRERERLARATGELRAEGRALEELIDRLTLRADGHRAAIADHADQLTRIGGATATRLVAIGETLREGTALLSRHAGRLDAAADSARTDIGVLIDDLPRATGQVEQLAMAIGAAGEVAMGRIEGLRAGLAELRQAAGVADEIATGAAHALACQIEQIDGHAAAASARIEGVAAGLDTRVAAACDIAEAGMESVRGGVNAQGDALAALVEHVRAALEIIGRETATSLNARIADMSGGIDGLGDRLSAQQETARALFVDLTRQLAEIETRQVALTEAGVARNKALASSVADVGGRLEQLTHLVGASDLAGGAALARAAELEARYDRLAEALGDGMPVLIDAVEARLGALDERAGAVAPRLAAIATHAEQAGARIGAAGADAERVLAAADEMSAAVDTRLAGIDERLATLRGAIGGLGDETAALSDGSASRLLETLARAHDAGRQAAERTREAIAAIVPQAAARMGDEAAASLGGAVDAAFAAKTAALADTAERSTALIDAAAVAFGEKIAALEAMLAAAEARVEATQASADQAGDGAFSRRLTLMIEALNSTAIDVTKILSNDVTDTAWAAYLKGDRGVFARRAVRLLDGGETREIARHYESDGEFHAQVDRYVHDFEAMLRDVLAFRQGTPMGVTLLSSDVGKLYVALAQAIERLRT